MQSTTANQLYGTDSTGAQSTYVLATTYTASSVPVRNTLGQIEVGTPTFNSHAATKQYVDNSATTTKQYVNGIFSLDGTTLTITTTTA